MRNLYSKIYEAIGAGIQKALVLPDETDDDISVKFRHKTISNDFTPYELQTVDLGLSVKWCKYNLGAFPGSKPEDWYGNYYAWGETAEKYKYDWEIYKYGTDKSSLTKYNNTDGKVILDADDDVIAFTCGGNWRMPTMEECQELIDNTTSQVVTDYNGVSGLNGRIFTASNGNTLFIPAAGLFRGEQLQHAGFLGALPSNTLYQSIPTYMRCFRFYSNSISVYYNDRCNGYTVRGVCI